MTEIVSTRALAKLVEHHGIDSLPERELLLKDCEWMVSIETPRDNVFQLRRARPTSPMWWTALPAVPDTTALSDQLRDLLIAHHRAQILDTPYLFVP